MKPVRTIETQFALTRLALAAIRMMRPLDPWAFLIHPPAALVFKLCR